MSSKLFSLCVCAALLASCTPPDTSGTGGGGGSSTGGGTATGGGSNTGGGTGGGGATGGGTGGGATGGGTGGGATGGGTGGGTTGGGTGGGATGGGTGGGATGGGTGGGATGGGGGSTGLPSTTATAIAVGRQHSCAVTAAGKVRCWGAAPDGQLGNGIVDSTSTGIFSTPVEVQGITAGATAISSFGDHTCVVVSGGVKCWGPNDYGQLGNGTTSTTPSATPVAVSLPGGFTASKIAVGEFHSCALSTGGAVKCWGRNDYGQLGNNTTVAESATPVDPVGLSSGVRAIAAGRYHVCAALTAGGAKCWGGNLFGEQGIGSYGTGEHSPVTVTNLSGLTATAVGAGDSTSCLVISDGSLRCWGKDYDGELGNGMSGFNTDQYAPVPVSNVSSGATDVSSGYGFTCAVVSGSAKCWGSNGYYGLGVGQNASFTSNVPAQVTGLTSGVSAIAATSSDHACAVTTAGAVKCWGSGSGGHLGAGNEDDALTPVSVISLP